MFHAKWELHHVFETVVEKLETRFYVLFCSITIFRSIYERSINK